MDITFGTWNVRSLYRAGSLATVARETAKYKLDLVEYKSDGTEVAVNQQVIIHFSMETGMRIIN
jgi:hypothetical protein